MIYYNGANMFEILLEHWKLWSCLCFIFFIYYHYTSTFDYFEKRKIKYMKPIFFFGNSLDRIMCKKSYSMFQLHVHNHFKGQPCGGVFGGRKPILYIIDPEIIKAVLIRDFDHFTDRTTIQNNEPEYLKRSVALLKGSEWKTVRSLITPAFSSGRLKNMFPLVQQCTSQFVSYLDKYNKTDVDAKDVIVQLTLEIIGVCAFGISSDTLKDENAEFKKIAVTINDLPMIKRLFLSGMLLFSPSLLNRIDISLFNYDSVKKLLDILRENRSKRLSTGFRRNDFLQLMMDTSEKEKENVAITKGKIKLDDDTIDAQALFVHVAGFETTSSALSFTIYELALNADVQEKARAHIEEVTKGEQLCYDHLADLDYLEAVITESLRFYSPVSRIDRVCTKPYILPGTSIHIAVGDAIAVSVSGVHMDPDIYPEPETFKPERFLREAKNKRLFMSFGVGSRSCIGYRFSMIVLKTVLASLLKHYKFSVCEKTEVPIKISKKIFLLKAENGIWVHIEKI